MPEYATIFSNIEQTLLDYGSQNRPMEDVRRFLDSYKYSSERELSDEEYYWVLVYVVFYSGFRAATVTDKIDTIHRHLSDYATVAKYDDADVNRILSDSGMIRNAKKVQACIDNARAFIGVLEQHGSFRGYIDSFDPLGSFQGLDRLRDDLQKRFSGIGPITVYHVMTDIGLPVLKPDRVVCRMFQRLGLIESESDHLDAIRVGREIAEATGQPIRYVDAVFVIYGQVKSEEAGILKGICLKDDPQCSICSVTQYCHYFAARV